VYIQAQRTRVVNWDGTSCAAPHMHTMVSSKQQVESHRQV